ncbi:MAG: hypothetical protein ACEQSK_09890 [Sphingomonadaceae bacterium]
MKQFFARLTRLLLPAPAPILDYSFAASDLARYHSTVAAPGSAMLDAQTWDDMLLPAYSASLTPQTSIFGQQELLHRLRGGAGTDVARLRLLLDDQPLRLRVQQACRDLRRADQEVSAPLFEAAQQAQLSAPALAAWLGWLPIAFLLALVAGLASGWLLLWGAVVLLWLLLMAVQMRYHERVSDWNRSLHSLQQMLGAHVLLAEVDAVAAPLRAGAAQAGRLNRALTRSPLDQLPGVSEYSDWLLLKNVRHYFASRTLVAQHVDFLRDSFRSIAALEADLALAQHLAQVCSYSWAQPSDRLQLTRVVHPLLAQAAPLSFALQDGQGAFISGQNGIGKSTLLRTLGLNLITARAFGFCYAEQAAVPLLPVYSSMQSEDTLGSESLYQAELRRAQQLLALGERGPALFVIDEIFRGTNHLESVSAAAAVLHTLAARGTVLVSSHNLVLASLLEDRLSPWCVSAPDGARTRLTLARGLLADTNGLALLSARGFDPAISAKAARVFDWLSSYLSQPANAALVMEGG